MFHSSWPSLSRSVELSSSANTENISRNIYIYWFIHIWEQWRAQGEGGCGVAPPGDLRGGHRPPGVSPPPGHPRGGRRPPLNLLRGGEVLDDQYLSKICLKKFLAPCGRQFCNFLQDFRPPLGKSRPTPEGGQKFLRGGGEKNRARSANMSLPIIIVQKTHYT